MLFGLINLFCPMCGARFKYNDPRPPYLVFHHKKFGVICSEGCYRKAELKYARMILGKDDDSR